jgi:maltodextrin utilization protein YvdJ
MFFIDRAAANSPSLTLGLPAAIEIVVGLFRSELLFSVELVGVSLFIFIVFYRMLETQHQIQARTRNL